MHSRWSQELLTGLITDPIPGPREPVIHYKRDSSVPHAQIRVPKLSLEQKKQAVRNVLRYFPPRTHATLGPEFLSELEDFGHIYCYRFMPTYRIRAYPYNEYPARIPQAKAMQLMIMNNLDPEVAQFPHELITYGGNGSVFSNWAQYHLVMHYLSILDDSQTLVLYSGHPLGLFPSSKEAPRAILSNGQVIPHFSTKADYETMYAMGATIYGQMTAGSWCYIGPQGIVHGTAITILNAGRKYLQLNDLGGRVFVSSGLGGMSGAQPKASTIAGCISVTAEIDLKAAQKRLNQGWVNIISSELEEVVDVVRKHRNLRKVVSVAYHGNVIDLWERFAKEKDLLVDLGSDQTSCHNVFGGGYYPAGLSFDQSNTIMHENPPLFKKLVQESLVRHIDAINKLCNRGMKFWDYGNAFLLEASRAGAEVMKDETRFRYPSYVEDIMGDVFSLGFGPFRWVCTSGLERDLETTDKVATEICKRLLSTSNERSSVQYSDNLKWIEQAGEHKLVVGSQARILYSDHVGRVEIAKAFNKLVADGIVSSPIVISRDHHDVGGTDSPYRETANITDGSQFTSDMATQSFVGNAVRSASWVSLHNGGGVGFGLAINGGFGLVLDGSEKASRDAESVLFWDVINGVARRAYSGNENAKYTINQVVKDRKDLLVTVPYETSQEALDGWFNQ